MESSFKCSIEEELAVVKIDAPGQELNTWTQLSADDFKKTVDYLEKRKDSLRGVIFISAKKGSFHVGGDLKFIGKLADSDDGSAFQRFVGDLKESFSRIENLGIPTLAAIEGACMGGGYELALAMTARIASDSPQTKIGLPECNVGLFPGGGGTQRLPRLIGYPAIELILNGKILHALEAHHLGMVDRIAKDGNDLITEAKQFINEIIEDKVALRREVYDFSDLDTVIESARNKLLKYTRGKELPAHKYVLKAMNEGLRRSLEEGLAIEGRYFLEVFNTLEAKGSIHTFFLKTHSDKPKAMIRSNYKPKNIKKIAILGFGTMGRGLAVDILRQMQVPLLIKDYENELTKGKTFVGKVLHGLMEKGKLKLPPDDLMALLSPTSEWTDDFAEADLVIETVYEDAAVKEKVYEELCKYVRDDCIIASNTSGVPITHLARGVKQPQRFCGAHFFSPVWMMQLVEIVRGKETSLETIENLLHFCSIASKRPIVCNDSPGFVVNAMLFNYLLKTFDLLESGVSIEQIDEAMVAFGLPVGPIKLIDEVGIDTLYHAFTKSLNQQVELLDNVVKAGRFGRKKSGKGFFLADGSVDPEVLPLIPIKGKQKIYAMAEIQQMLFLPFVQVGKRLLEEEVVTDPRLIDIGAIWGTGFPAEKGGPMKWADLTGLSKRLYGFNFYSKFGVGEES